MNRALRTTLKTCLHAGLLVGSLAGFAGAALADGYPPFYGYSDYFGGPRVYFTPDNTIHQVTKPEGGDYGLGTRTYYRGGPFWTYEYNLRRPGFGRSERATRRRVVLRRRS